MTETNRNDAAEATAVGMQGASRRTDAQAREAIKASVAMRFITEEQGELLFWLHGYGQDANLSDADLARKLKVSSGTVSQLFSGKYGASDWTPMVEKIAAMKAVEEAEAAKVDLGFIMTDTARTIFAACDAAMTDGMPAFIYGASQIGKTTALVEYQRTHNHGRTKYLRIGSRWTKARLVRELAKACNKKSIRDQKAWALEDEIVRSLNRYNLLIVDEFHLAMETVSDATSREIVEYIREVFDRTRCGLVLSSTKVGLHDLEEGKNAMLFDQMRRRGVLKVVLPDVPKVRDVNLIARHFGLELPKGDLLALIKQLLKTRGLGVFVKYLQKAHALASGGKSPHEMTWADFEYVHNGYTKLADMENDY